MAKIDTMNVSAGSIVSGCTLKLRVTGMRTAMTRMRLGMKVLKLAVAIMGCRLGANRGERIMIKPSPYFNVIVDQRAGKVAASMAGRAARVGAQGAEIVLLRKRQGSKLSRLIRWWKSL